jgi:hypothetical protein
MSCEINCECTSKEDNAFCNALIPLVSGVQASGVAGIDIPWKLLISQALTIFRSQMAKDFDG